MNTVTAISRNSLLLGLFAALTTALIAWTYLSTKDAIVEAQRVAEAKQLLQIFPANSHDNSLIDDNFTITRGQSLLKVREDRLAYRVRKDGDTVGVILPATAHDGLFRRHPLTSGCAGRSERCGSQSSRSQRNAWSG